MREETLARRQKHSYDVPVTLDSEKRSPVPSISPHLQVVSCFEEGQLRRFRRSAQAQSPGS
jgi:hypothetical protein